MKFMVGADPELFLQDAKGKIISAIGKIGGTKANPIPIKELGKGFCIQEDNVLCEYNVPPVGLGDLNMWVSNHNRMLEYLSTKVGKLGLSLKTSASEILDDDQLMDPKAHVFGCEPDLNAWTLEFNPSPQCDEPRLRSAGGHVHVGAKLSKVARIQLVRWLDVLLGVPAMLVDKDTRRRKLYGKPGAFRWKPYGVEYRTLSNFWLGKPEHIAGIMNGVNHALCIVEDNQIIPTEVAEMTHAALGGNLECAERLIEKYGTPFN